MIYTDSSSGDTDVYTIGVVVILYIRNRSSCDTDIYICARPHTHTHTIE